MGINTSIKATNLVINNSGQSSFAATLGGKYDVSHSTIVNYWTNSNRQLPALLINNYQETDDSISVAPLVEANFSNCIIYGNDTTEFLVDEIQDDSNIVDFNFKFTNCLAKFPFTSQNFTGPNYQFTNEAKYENIRFNQAPEFRNILTNRFEISTTSPAINEGNTTIASQTPFDILNIDRTTSPDLGAYQNSMF